MDEGGGTPTTAEQVRARLHVEGIGDDGALVGPVVRAATAELGLGREAAEHLADAAGAVCRAVRTRGFDDPSTAALDVTVLRRGHQVLVRLDDLGLPFAYEDEDGLDGDLLRRALSQGWVDEVRHEWRGRQGNRTVLVRHRDGGDDLRDGAAPDQHLPEDVPPATTAEDELTRRAATTDDVEGICRLTWRTYGPTYQHDEYYRPERLAELIESGRQGSFVVTSEADGVVGHLALVLDEPGEKTVDAGRAMVDPRYRGHHLLGPLGQLTDPWTEAHGILAWAGGAVTAHTRSQTDHTFWHLSLGFLPPIEFAAIGGTTTTLREALVGGFVPRAPIPAQSVRLPTQDLDVLARLYALASLDRSIDTAGGMPAPGSTSRIDVQVHNDLGHAVLRVHEVGADLVGAVRRRRSSIVAGGVEVTYLDVRLDADTTTWAAEALAPHGFFLAGLLPLGIRGVDAVRYQHLGDLVVDPDAIHLKAPAAQELLAYVIAQREERR